MRFNYKVSNRLVELLNAERDISEDVRLQDIPMWCENIVNLTAEDISPFVYKSIQNVIVINDHLVDLYNQKRLISKETEYALRSLISDYESEGYTGLYDYVESFREESIRYRKNRFNAYIGDDDDYEDYLEKQMDLDDGNDDIIKKNNEKNNYLTGGKDRDYFSKFLFRRSKNVREVELKSGREEELERYRTDAEWVPDEYEFIVRRNKTWE